MLKAVSPIDGRYRSKTRELGAYFSEHALIKYRIHVEIEYLAFLNQLEVIQMDDERIGQLRELVLNFDEDGSSRVKEIEKETNHDVKAVEYFIKEQLSDVLTEEEMEFVHFGLTSQDINNTALPLLIKDSINNVIYPGYHRIAEELRGLGIDLIEVPMLARTHGQPASPTTIGKEILVFVERLDAQLNKLANNVYYAKFGGATGNFNAHKVAYPDINWPERANLFIESLGLKRHALTTQIAHYDDMSETFQIISRVNVILIDLCRDIWTYISQNYFSQRAISSEVGSSAMPHKVNPIDFENAEGNLGMANAILNFLSQKLPISRLQRDLSDSTVTRNIGVPFAHSLIAIKSILKGIDKLQINEASLTEDLEKSWAVVSEGIQTVLRREGYKQPYELLKEFSRGKVQLTRSDFEEFIEQLEVNDSIKNELRSITPFNYIGFSKGS